MKGEVAAELRYLLLFLALDAVLTRWPPAAISGLTDEQIKQLRTVHSHLMRDVIDMGLDTYTAMLTAAEDAAKEKS